MKKPTTNKKQPGKNETSHDDTIESLMARMVTYRFRAECWHDVLQLLQIMTKDTVVKYFDSRMSFPEILFPDVVCDIKVPLTLDELRLAMAQVRNGHVMYQTVAKQDVYTGDRNDSNIF